jgi:hypothetical protein
LKNLYACSDHFADTAFDGNRDTSKRIPDSLPTLMPHLNTSDSYFPSSDKVVSNYSVSSTVCQPVRLLNLNICTPLTTHLKYHPNICIPLSVEVPSISSVHAPLSVKPPITVRTPLSVQVPSISSLHAPLSVQPPVTVRTPLSVRVPSFSNINVHSPSPIHEPFLAFSSRIFSSYDPLCCQFLFKSRQSSFENSSLQIPTSNVSMKSPSIISPLNYLSGSRKQIIIKSRSLCCIFTSSNTIKNK